ncbi:MULTISPECIES: hypothetical protein [Clostridium]|nr:MULTISPECIES: hypothetical protein [Clostridium]NRT80826.1 ribosomal-protein-alanine N-acetyltransferase [Clostridium beijerinckii]OOM50659.1 hypothetical protein CBEIJ_01920 [Clostridium beijerinckii]
MNKNPYEQFPYIADDEITLRKIVDTDLDEILKYMGMKNFLNIHL